MKRILVPIDFSEDSVFALNIALELANSFGARLRMIHVKTGHNYAPEFSGDNPELRILGQVTNWMDHLLNKNLPEYTVSHGQFDYKIREGNVMREITNQALYDDTSLIVVGTHGISGIEDRWVGSNAYRLVSNAPCPVLTVRRTMKWQRPHNILLPMDENRLLRKIIPTVAGFSTLINASVTLLALQKKSIWMLPAKSNMYARQAQRYINKNYDLGVSIVSCDWKGDAERILKFAHDENVSVIAIGLLKTRNPFGSFLRSFYSELLNLSDIPVLVVPMKE